MIAYRVAIYKGNKMGSVILSPKSKYYVDMSDVIFGLDIGKKFVAKIGKLFVMDTFEHARVWLKSIIDDQLDGKIPSYVIWEVEVPSDARMLPYCIKIDSNTRDDIIKDYWQVMDSGIEHSIKLYPSIPGNMVTPWFIIKRRIEIVNWWDKQCTIT